MEVFGVEEFGLTILDPLGTCQGLALWAMPVSARVVTNAFMLALVALFQVTAQSGSPAQFDGTHDPALRRGQRSSMLFPIGFAVATQHVGDFQLGTIHESSPQKHWGVAGLVSVGKGCGNKSSGLAVEHTLLVAMRRYFAVVARLRCPRSS